MHQAGLRAASAAHAGNRAEHVDIIAELVHEALAQALRARGITTVADALRTVTGATVVETGPLGSATSLFLRGGESNMVRVLLDGVPVNAPELIIVP